MRNHFGGILLFITIVLIAVLVQSDPLESDQSVERDFRFHSIQYEQLVQMLREDGDVNWINFDSTCFNDGTCVVKEGNSKFSSQRWTEYRQKLNNLRLVSISRRNGVITFDSVSAAVRDIDDSYEYIVISKGLAYTESLPANTRESLNELGFEPSETLYKPIGQNWYIYREWGIGKPE